MLKLLSTVKQEVVVKVEIQEVFMNLPMRREFQTHPVSNMSLLISINNIQGTEDAQPKINAKTAHGHHAQKDKHAKINAGLLIISIIMLATTIVSAEHPK